MYWTGVRFMILWAFLTMTSLPSSLGKPKKENGERQCYPPWEPINGYFTIWGEGLLVEFGCNDGFTLLGDSFGACDTSIGLWTVNTPLCLGNNCKVPKIFPHGQVTIRHNGGLLDFSCANGYHLYGSNVLSCNGDDWNATIPNCLKNRGRYPSSFQEKLANAKRHRLQQSKSNATHLSESDNSCNAPGYAPPQLPHAYVRANYHYDTEKKTYVMMAVYSCNGGYKLKYPEMRHLYCKQKKWVGPLMPECVQNETSCEKKNGGCEQLCHLLKGGYACACREGFTLTENRRNCMDVNECLFDNGNCHQECFNTAGSFFCACSPGYFMDQAGHCKDINECTSTKKVACPGPCINTPGSYRCNCSIEGYKESQNPHSCADVNECLSNNGGCEDKCENLRGSYRCRCEKKGYHLAPDRHTCKDIDECKRYRKACRGGKCYNTEGSYVCRCNKSFKLSADQAHCNDIDECKVKNGGCSMGCENLIGSFKCTCPEKAYTLAADGSNCIDVDECENDNGGCSQKCINTKGSYKCDCTVHGKVLADDGHTCQSCPENTYYVGSKKTCKKCPANSHTRSKSHLTIAACVCNKGFDGNPSQGISCTDIDECNAPPKQSMGCVYGCLNTPGSASCTCPNGFLLQDNHKNCSDINECATDNGGCQQICINSEGGHMCECHGPGFRLSEDNHTCIDLNECFDGFGCEYDCLNTKGSAQCICPEGYKLDDNQKNCTDINECQQTDNICDDKCVNTKGSYECLCNSPGLKLSYDKQSCIDINECVEGFNLCEDLCLNTIGGFYCECKTIGYRLGEDKSTCKDIDECASHLTNACDQVCSNVPGSYDCDCDPGYSIDDNFVCSECPMNTFRTAKHQQCVLCPSFSQTNGTAKTSIEDCFCYDGYKGNPAGNTQCTDIEECQNNTLGCVYRCHNTEGGAYCSCPTGFKLRTDGRTCTDIDECELYNGNCAQICINNNGSYECQCNEKRFYLGKDKHSCEDIDECAIENYKCSHNCINTVGGAYCGCKTGYRLLKDEKKCADFNECVETPNICDDVCINTIGSYKCLCNKTGFILHQNKRTCSDINECQQNATLCDQMCENTQGSYHCLCKSGFGMSKNGHTCEDKDECSSEGSHGCSSICVNIPGSYMCDCPPGNEVVGGKDCRKCKHDHYRSEKDKKCKRCPPYSNTINDESVSIEDCVCGTGYIRGRTGEAHCTDIHECMELGMNCTMFCQLSAEGPYCTCPKGYALAENEFDCNDINECKLNNGDCEHVCTNSQGGYKCECSSGFRPVIDKPSSCEEIDECEMNNGNCSHRCVNEVGSYHCECNNGYTLDQDKRTCLSPTCFNFRAPNHGKVVTKGCQDPKDEDIFTGLTCQVKCFAGYQIEGTELRTCLKNGTWSGVSATCIEINECKLDNGNCSQKCVNDEGSYHCECHFGYTLHTDGHNCISKPCAGLVAPKFGKTTPQKCLKIEGDEVKPGTLCNIQCLPGYKLKGSPRRICYKNGTWSGNESRCKEINECKLDNGDCSQKCVNDEGSYHCECHFGYTLHTDGRNCISKPCPGFVTPSFGKVVPPECLAKDVKAGTKCYFQCFKGYKIKGSLLRICRGNTTWSGVNSICKEINECKLDNGNCSQRCVNDEGSYHCECHFGYTLHTDGRTCLSKPCHALLTPDFGKVLPPKCLYSDGNDLKPGTKCKVRCLRGYKIHGSKVRVCQQNGTWSGKDALCKVKGCTMLEEIPNGFAGPSYCQQKRVHVSEYCQIVCKPGYQLVGEPITECLQTQKWSIKLPKCEPIKPIKGVTCPSDVHIILPKGKSSIPAVAPGIQGALDFKIIPDLKRFSFGNTQIKLVATSVGSREEVKCNYTVHVIDKEPPMVSRCVKIVRNIAWQNKSKLCWHEPVFTDNTGVKRIIKNKKPGISNVRIGVQRIVYTAWDLQGNVAKCIFTLQIKAAICPKLERAANNQLYCKYTLEKVQICKAICKEGFVFPDETTTKTFICDPAEKKWKPPHIKLMACIKM